MDNPPSTYVKNLWNDLSKPEYEDVPAKAIRQAVYKIMGVKENNDKPSGNSGCCGNGGRSCC